MRDFDLGVPGVGSGVPGESDTGPGESRDAPVRRRRLRWREGDLLGVIAAGGMLGAAGRYGVGGAVPAARGGMPWATLLVNATGCLLIGVLMVLIVEVGGAHRLLRPFLGVGILGGYTTFSTYSLEAQQLALAGRPGLAVVYVTGTAAAALVAVQTGVWLTRAMTRRRHSPGDNRGDRSGDNRGDNSGDNRSGGAQ